MQSQFKSKRYLDLPITAAETQARQMYSLSRGVIRNRRLDEGGIQTSADKVDRFSLCADVRPYTSHGQATRESDKLQSNAIYKR